MKAYTDISQSKKLAEILPLESADMSWVSNGLGKPFTRTIPVKGDPEELCACWSLAALLDVIPCPSLHQVTDVWRCDSCDKDGNLLAMTYGESPIDACYEMILKLNELNLL